MKDMKGIKRENIFNTFFGCAIIVNFTILFKSVLNLYVLFLLILGKKQMFPKISNNYGYIFHFWG